MVEFPQMFRIRQLFQGPEIEDVADEVHQQLGRLQLRERVAPGQSVAITAGSRGIANIHVILRAAAEFLRKLGAEPFVVPAMGSHGGGTAEGQLQVLASLGVTEQACQCPIRASMETVVVCQAAEGFPVYFDRLAHEADHVLVCGRVKPHTGFTGPIQSGLMKMLLIGLGKHDGAKMYHRAITDFSFDQIVRSVAGEVLRCCNILAGLAIVENAFDRTALIEAVTPEMFENREKELLKLAEQWMARLPFDQLDVLLIDEIGKNISGTGMDTNVVGRKHSDAAEHGSPRVKRIIVRGLTEATHGNACGIGMCDLALTRAIESIDQNATATNCITSNHVAAGMIPIHFATDVEVLGTALQTIGLTDPVDARVAWIHNTLDLTELECSAAFWRLAQERPDLQILTEPRPLPFDPLGMLPAVRQLAAEEHRV